MLIWQLATKNVSMTASPLEDPLSLTYPAHVANDSIAFLSSVSLSSIIAHGPGMVGEPFIFVQNNKLTSPAGSPNL